MDGIKKFTPDVIEKLKYYVYRLIDPRNGQTFYVGKGKGNRVFAHINNALKNYEGEKYISEDEDVVSSKIQQIRAIRNDGLNVIHIIQRYGFSEKEAFEVEAALIDCFAGLTNLQSGHFHDRSVSNAETLQINLSCEEFVDVKELDYCIIKINDFSMDNGDLYERVRKYWRVNLSRVNEIPYILASVNGVVREVYKIEKWYNSKECLGRCMFDGGTGSRKHQTAVCE